MMDVIRTSCRGWTITVALLMGLLRPTPLLASTGVEPGPEHFEPVVEWVAGYGRSSGGWDEEYPREVGDVNGDGLLDIVAFGHGGTYVSFSTGAGFTPSAMVLGHFGLGDGWQRGWHPRRIGDVDGDGLDDIVGFPNHGTVVARSTGSGFEEPALWLSDYGFMAGGWLAEHPRELGDVDGDGRDDVVGFPENGIYVSFSTGSGFTPATHISSHFGGNQGYRVEEMPRLLADVNGDGRDDAIAFASDGVMVALSNGSGFEAPKLWLVGFGTMTGGWGYDYPRVVADVNGDGLADVIGFGSQGTFVALSNGTGFEPPRLVSSEFGTNRGWT